MCIPAACAHLCTLFLVYEVRIRDTDLHATQTQSPQVQVPGMIGEQSANSPVRTNSLADSHQLSYDLSVHNMSAHFCTLFLVYKVRTRYGSMLLRHRVHGFYIGSGAWHDRRTECEALQLHLGSAWLVHHGWKHPHDVMRKSVRRSVHSIYSLYGSVYGSASGALWDPAI